MSNDFTEASLEVEGLIDRLTGELADANEESMDDVTRATKRQLSQNDSVATGALRAVLHTEQVTDLDRRDVIAAHATVAPERAKYLEYGTGVRGSLFGPTDFFYDAPSPRPPFEAILTWIEEKNIEPRADGIDTRVELAFAIQETIGAVGTYAHPFMRPVWASPQGKPSVILDHAEAIRSAVKRQF